jgi:hypothetical protein
MLEMTAEEAAERGKSLSFEKIWAAFQETDRQFKETDRKIAESAKQLTQLEKNLDRMGINVGGLNRSLSRPQPDMPYPPNGGCGGQAFVLSLSWYGWEIYGTGYR